MNTRRLYRRPPQPRLIQVTGSRLSANHHLYTGPCRLMGLTMLAETGASACYPIIFDSAVEMVTLPTTAKTDVTQAGVLSSGVSIQGIADGDDVFGDGIWETPDRVLVYGADDPSECGIYEMTVAGPIRPTDADADDDFATSWKVTNVNTSIVYLWIRPQTPFALGTSPVIITPQTISENSIIENRVASLYMWEGPSVIHHDFSPGLICEKGLFLRFASDWKGYVEQATGYWQVTAVIEA